MIDVELNVKDVITKYKSFTLSNVSFDLKSGDVMGLVGRSGSGKSTIIKTLLGFKKQESGTISFIDAGIPLDFRKFVGYSPQENSLYEYLTLDENLKIFADLYGVNKVDFEKMSTFLLTKLKLLNHRKKKISDFSGGMQKRADLAVSLIHNPPVLILDEPFNGLDISIQKFIWDIVKDLSKQGRIIIVSSHIITDIMINCNKIGLVDRNTFYTTETINKKIKTTNSKNLVDFLGRLFFNEIAFNENDVNSLNNMHTDNDDVVGVLTKNEN